ncbi:DUF2945 domain-containing protein [Halodurantibacterium flavum]|uniref:DUF2945 domain-containing protein n=1 Tax=Halodurantibacterium flavum TaxID=1382802 RepID=A0ABW4S5C5_9RHOB
MVEFQKGDRVSWRWGSGRGEGEVVEVFTRRVSRTIKGRKITRNGSARRPAYLLRQGGDGSRAGGHVLKSETELSPVPG